MLELITIAELADILQLSQQTIRNLLCTRPERLPRARRLSGTNLVYFRLDDVRVHLRKQASSSDAKNKRQKSANSA